MRPGKDAPITLVESIQLDFPVEHERCSTRSVPKPAPTLVIERQTDDCLRERINVEWWIGDLPIATRAVGRRLFRHVMSHDLVPALPPVSWGSFVHFGNEYRHENGEWIASKTLIVQPARVREAARALLRTSVAPSGGPSGRFDVKAHLSQHYISAMRPPGLLTEFGDYD